jgi:N-acetylglucosaminyldiphosphoundecaprenol N-acetyl-beta-D-mannosaminyltransferase
LAWDEAIERVISWGTSHTSRYVCVCNVHSVVTATRDAGFKRALMDADLATCDGAPIAWMMRRLGYPEQERIAGPDLMWRYLRAVEPLRHRIYLYGSTEETLVKLRAVLAREFPGVVVAGMHSPAFDGFRPVDDEGDVAAINASGANVVFVGLGCPKQEKWMAEHRERVNAVMIGVGAAFDYHAGTLARAPGWAQRYGLEWLYRLACEPRRLMRRYVVTNSLFLVGAAVQLANARFGPRRATRAVAR